MAKNEERGNPADQQTLLGDTMGAKPSSLDEIKRKAMEARQQEFTEEELDYKEAVEIATTMGGADFWKINQSRAVKKRGDTTYPIGCFIISKGDPKDPATEIVAKQDTIRCAVIVKFTGQQIYSEELQAKVCWSYMGVKPEPEVDSPCSPLCRTCPQKLKGGDCNGNLTLMMLMLDNEGKVDADNKALLKACVSELGEWDKYVRSLKDAGLAYTDVITELRCDGGEAGAPFTEAITKIVGQEAKKTEIALLTPVALRALEADEMRLAFNALQEIADGNGRWGQSNKRLQAIMGRQSDNAALPPAQVITSPAEALPAEKPRDFGEFPASDGKIMNRFQLIKNITGVAKDSLGWDRAELDSWIKIRPYGKELMLEDMSDDQIRFVTAELGEVIGVAKK